MTPKQLRTRTRVRTLLAAAIVVYAIVAAGCVELAGPAAFILVGPAVGLLWLLLVAVSHQQEQR